MQCRLVGAGGLAYGEKDPRAVRRVPVNEGQGMEGAWRDSGDGCKRDV